MSLCPVGCGRKLAPAKPLCRQCWFRTPPELQRDILDTQQELLSGYEQELFGLDNYDTLVSRAVDLLRQDV